ncbi:Mrp/NBP35 family ATP-binding protein [Vulgatibacter sp.]|uniref:Mrp/NBP35 family ATP-binding protein n=1 Tax=Vulgatibacter sp. TaxID=1971226 RepID=UPI0035658440
MSQLTEREILAALSKVNDPELHRDLVSLNMVQNVRIEGGGVKLRIDLTTPACPLKGKIQGDVENALRAVPGVTAVEIEWGAQVRHGQKQEKGGNFIPGVKNVVLVGAGKGGVGKSTVALNLAAALRLEGATVGLLDADFYGPSVPIMTGISGKPTSVDGRTLEPMEAHGLKVMSIGFLVEPDQAMVWRGPMLHSAITQLLRDVNWGNLDYLVLDLPPGTGDVPLSLAQIVKAAGVVLVSTPQDVALADVVKAKAMFDRVDVPVLGIVENMSDFVCPHCEKSTPIFSTGGTHRAGEAMGIPLLGAIPLDLAIRMGGDKGTPVTVEYPDSKQAQAFREMARKVAGRISVQAHQVKLPVFNLG